MNKIKKSYGICVVKQSVIINRNSHEFEQLREGDLIRILQTDSDQSDKVIVKLFNSDTNTFKTDIYECAKRDIDFIGDALWLFLIGSKVNQIRTKIYNERDLVLGLNCGSEITIKSFGNDANANIKCVVRLIDNVKEFGFGNLIGLKLQSMPHNLETYNHLLGKHHNPSISPYLLFRIEQLLDDLKYAADQKRFQTRDMNTTPELPLFKTPEIIRNKIDSVKRSSFMADERVDIPVDHQFPNPKGPNISKVDHPVQSRNEYFNQSEVNKVSTMPNTGYYAPNGSAYASPTFEVNPTLADIKLSQLYIGTTPNRTSPYMPNPAEVDKYTTMANTSIYPGNRNMSQADMNKLDQFLNRPAGSNNYYSPNGSNYGTTAGFDMNPAEVGKVNTMPNTNYYMPSRNFSGSSVLPNRAEVDKRSTMSNTSNYEVNHNVTHEHLNNFNQFNNTRTGPNNYYPPNRSSYITSSDMNTAATTNPTQLTNIKFEPVNIPMPNRQDSYTSTQDSNRQPRPKDFRDKSVSRNDFESNHISTNDFNQNKMYNAKKNTLPYHAEQKIANNMSGAGLKNDEPAAFKKKKGKNKKKKVNMPMENFNERKNFKCHLCEHACGNDALHLKCNHCICIGCFRNIMSRLIGTNQVWCPFRNSKYACQYKLQNFEVTELRKKINQFDILSTMVNPPSSTDDDSEDDEELYSCKTNRCNGQWVISKSGAVNLFRCPVCEVYNCVHCKNIHENMTCKEYQQKVKDAGRYKIQNMAEKVGNYVASRFIGGGADRHRIPDGADGPDGNETLIQCAKRNCEGRWFKLEADKSTLYKCPTCELYNCSKCNAIHQNQSCSEYKESQRYIPKMFRNVSIRSPEANKPDIRADDENAKIPANATDDHLKKRKWNCTHCTFENFSFGVICNMCGGKS